MDRAFTYYATLGVHASSTEEEIKLAYARAAREQHPDKGGDADTFAKTAEAYSAIRTPKARATLRARLVFIGDACPACEGFGYRLRMRAAGAEYFACTPCGGAGYMPRLR